MSVSDTIGTCKACHCATKLVGVTVYCVSCFKKNDDRIACHKCLKWIGVVGHTNPWDTSLYRKTICMECFEKFN